MITLIHDLVIDVSQNNYTLVVDKNKCDKNGNPIRETVGYFGTLEGAVQAAKNYCIRKKLEADTFTLAEAIKVIRECNKEFMDLLKDPVDGERKEK